MLVRLITVLTLSGSAFAQTGWFCRAGLDIGVNCPCGGTYDGTPTGCANSGSANGAFLISGGQTSVSADSFSVVAGNLPAGASTAALLVQGAMSITPTAFGDGVRCIGGSMIRVSTLHPLTGGELTYGVGGDVPISIRGQVPANGGYRCYQAWYRNPAAFCTPDTFNMTNAIGVTWTP